MMHLIEFDKGYVLAYEGVSQRMFQVGEQILSALYPFDNLESYVADVEKLRRKEKYSEITDVLSAVDKNCAECMMSLSLYKSELRLNLSQKFKEELVFEKGLEALSEISQPFQLGIITENGASIIYSPQTKISLAPKNYLSLFGNFSENKNRKNEEIYLLIGKCVECIRKEIPVDAELSELLYSNSNISNKSLESITREINKRFNKTYFESSIIKMPSAKDYGDFSFSSLKQESGEERSYGKEREAPVQYEINNVVDFIDYLVRNVPEKGITELVEVYGMTRPSLALKLCCVQLAFGSWLTWISPWGDLIREAVKQ